RSIVEDSRAALAGLEEGDIVIAIDNNANQDFTQYKKVLTSARKRVRRIIRRDEEPLDVSVKLLSRLSAVWYADYLYLSVWKKVIREKINGQQTRKRNVRRSHRTLARDRIDRRYIGRSVGCIV